MSLLVNQSQVNADTSFIAPASGGGGGGGGPNLTLSSLTMNSAGAGINFPVGASTFGVSYTGILDENNTPTNTLGFINNTGAIGLGLDIATGGLYIVGDGGSFGSAPSAHLNLAGPNLTVQAPVSGGGTISLLSPTSISSLTVSSINGVAPGGGGGIQSTIANGAANISIPAGAVPMSFNLTEGASFTTPGNAGGLLFNGDITNNAANPANFNNGVRTGTAIVSTIQSGSAPMLIDGQGFPISITASDIYIGSTSTFISSLFVSSLNSAAYPPAASLTNFQVPFIGGTLNTNLYAINVNSNTTGIPVQLTSTLITNSSHKYLVSYNLASGSNSDLTSYTKINLYAAAGGYPTMQSSPGSANYWFYNGNVGARSLIISGAGALRLEAGTNSATQSTILYFDNDVGFAITDLGT